MTAKPYHHGNLRSALLTAAREALRHQLPEELSLRQLAKEAGVSANAPYKHFPDRAALLAAVAADGYRALTEAIQQVTGRESDIPILTSLAEVYRGFALSEPGLFRLMFRSGEGASPERDEAAQELFAELLAIIDREHGLDDPEESIRLTVGLWSTLHGATLFALDGTLEWLESWLQPPLGTLVTATVDGLRHPRRSGRRQ